MMAERSLWVERKLSAPAVGVQFSLVPLSFPWGAGLGPSAVLTLEQRVEAEWFDYPKGKTGVSLTERFPMPPSSLLGQGRPKCIGLVGCVDHEVRCAKGQHSRERARSH